MEEWYNLKKIEANPGGIISASIVVPSDSPWFSGHFPDNPILPAIGQLAMVQDLIEKACGRELIPKAVMRAKYRRIIRPGETVNIILTPVEGKTMTYAFQLDVNGEMACRGSMQTAASKCMDTNFKENA